MTAWFDSSSFIVVVPFEPFGSAMPKVEGEKREDRGKGESGLGDTLADAMF